MLRSDQRTSGQGMMLICFGNFAVSNCFHWSSQDRLVVSPCFSFYDVTNLLAALVHLDMHRCVFHHSGHNLSCSKKDSGDSLEFVKNLFNCSLPIFFQAGKEVKWMGLLDWRKADTLDRLTFPLFLFLSIADTICDSYEALRQCAEVDGVHPVLQILPGTPSIQPIKQLLLFKDKTFYRTEKQQLHSACTIAMIVLSQLISIICSS